MSGIDDGGPAFPIPGMPPVGTGDPRDGMAGGCDPHPGMSLRDWFAGMAMQGILAAQTEEGAFEYDDTLNAPHQDWVPRTAYFMAEAMLAARAINPTV